MLKLLLPNKQEKMEAMMDDIFMIYRYVNTLIYLTYTIHTNIEIQINNFLHMSANNSPTIIC